MNKHHVCGHDDVAAPDLHDGKNQIVLVFQGGGALGAYQAGVYQALHEAGVEPDWVIGTSIGAIYGAAAAAGLRSTPAAPTTPTATRGSGRCRRPAAA